MKSAFPSKSKFQLVIQTIVFEWNPSNSGLREAVITHRALFFVAILMAAKPRRRNSRRFCERKSSSVTSRAILAIIKAAKFT